MRKTRRVASAVLGLLLASSFIASADDSPAGDLGPIRAQQAELRDAALAGEGMFKEVSEDERTALASRQAQFLAMIEGKQAASELDAETRLAAHTLLQEINAAVDAAERLQVVCRSTKEVGSNRRSRRCTPVADESQARAAVQRPLDPAAVDG